MSTEAFDIRTGDIWAFYTNNGPIFRTITLIGNTRVSYRGGDGAERACLISTFKRWWRGAELYSRVEATSNAEVKPS